MMTVPRRPGWFCRHTEVLSVTDNDVAALQQARKIAIHYPGLGKRDSRSADPMATEYADDPTAQQVLRRFGALAKQGGYVWAEYRVSDVILVGRVLPQPIEFVDATWTESDDDRFEDRAGGTAVLKVLQLTDVVEIRPSDKPNLRNARPRQGTFSSWPSSDDQLAHIVNKTQRTPAWDSLSAAAQEVACSEFLRCHDLQHIPRLARLLTPPGGTMHRVDVVGLAENGQRIFGQVTFYKESTPAARAKIRALESHAASDAVLVFFCRSPAKTQRGSVAFVPVENVWAWLQQQPRYMALLLNS